MDELKVDRSFVGQMASNTSDAVIVRSTIDIDLGHNLGLRVVAEGVVLSPAERGGWPQPKSVSADRVDMNGRAWRWYLLVGTAATLPILVIPNSWWYTAWYDSFGLSAVAAILLAMRANRSGARLTWWLLAAGQLLFVVGDLLFDLHERVWETDAFPSAADGFYLAGYLPLTTGLVLLIRARTPGRDRASLIDATIIATGLGLLSWVFLMKPAATDSTLTVVGRLISIAYPAADVLLLALVARLLVGVGVRNTAFQLLAGSLRRRGPAGSPAGACRC